MLGVCARAYVRVSVCARVRTCECVGCALTKINTTSRLGMIWACVLCVCVYVCMYVLCVCAIIVFVFLTLKSLWICCGDWLS